MGIYDNPDIPTQCRDRPRVCPHHLSIRQDGINIRADQGRKKSHAVGIPNWQRVSDSKSPLGVCPYMRPIGRVT